MATRDTFLRQRLREAIAGAAEAIYPPNDQGAPDWRDTDLVERTIRWLDTLPAAKATEIRLLFTAVEMAPTALLAGVGRFSRLPRERRTALIRRMRGSKLFPLAMIGDALKATLNMMYLSHPAAMAWVGMVKPCAHPTDGFAIPVDEDILGSHEVTA